MQFWGQQFKMGDGFIEMDIETTFPQRDGQYISINQKILNFAFKNKIKVVKVDIDDHNIGIVNIPLKWIQKHAVKKEVVKNYPDNPMVLYYINISKFLK